MLNIHPEADPGDNDNENGWDVGLDQVESNAAVKFELCCQTTVVTCRNNFCNSNFTKKLHLITLNPTLHRLQLYILYIGGGRFYHPLETASKWLFLA